MVAHVLSPDMAKDRESIWKKTGGLGRSKIIIERLLKDY